MIVPTLWWECSRGPVIFFVNLVNTEDQNQDIAIFGSTYTYWSC
jgi:hypothetical protein